MTSILFIILFWVLVFYFSDIKKLIHEFIDEIQKENNEVQKMNHDDFELNAINSNDGSNSQTRIVYGNPKRRGPDKNDIKVGKLATCVVGGLFGLSLLMGCFSVIETGERGVVLRFGEYMYTMNEGLHFKAPLIDDVYKMQVRDRSYNSDVEVSSKDMQTIKISSALVYSLDESKVGDIYRRYGNNIETTIIKPTVAEVINSTIAQYPIEEFVNKRDEISQKIMNSLKTRLADIGIDIKSFLITNHDFSDDYNKAIEQKKIAEQAAITAEYNKQKAQLDSEANKYRQEGLSKYVLMEKFLDKWDGHMPKVLTGSDSNMSMILNTDDLNKE